jgi:2-octaprenyl-6-methoxyphenol hydroxylase
MREAAEVAVAGGGPVGLLAAQAFARMGLRVVVLETQPDGDRPRTGDSRRIVLAERARRLLVTHGLWTPIADCVAPVRRVVVRAPRLGSPFFLDAAAYGLEALGWSLGYDALVRALRRTVGEHPRVTLRLGTRLLAADEGPVALDLRLSGSEGEEILEADLLVAAEGAGADLSALGWPLEPAHEVRDTAWIVACRTRGIEPGTAVESFLDGGTATLLATAPDRAVVTVLRPAQRSVRGEVPDVVQRLARLATAFGLDPRALEPEGEGETIRVRRGLRARPYASRRLAVGTSFHALHPFAAQGLLLAWRDAALAARHLGLRRARGLSWTDAETLGTFARSRRREHLGIDAFVHRLPPLLSGPASPLGAPLWCLVSRTPLRTLVGYWGMGYGWGRA